MIPAISGISINNRNQQISQRNNIRFISLPKDTFEIRQKSNPAFGSVIPENEILGISNQFLKDIKNISDIKKLRETSYKFFYKDLNKILNPDGFPDFEPLNFSKDDLVFFKNFRHELKNIITNRALLVDESLSFSREIVQEDYPEIVTDKQYLKHLKKALKGAVIDIKETINTWNLLEDWYKNPEKEVPFKDVLKLIKRIPKNKNLTPSWGELEILNDKQVKEPTVLYQLLSQPLLNAIKYGEGKPFQIKIEEVVSDGRKDYYALFINPETKPIPDAEIDKIIEGLGYRASNARKTKIIGSGLGFSELVPIVKKKAKSVSFWDDKKKAFYNEDLLNLIEKGREKGVCVRVPLFGIQ